MRSQRKQETEMSSPRRIHISSIHGNARMHGDETSIDGNGVDA
jgi:hypothetical protein